MGTVSSALIYLITFIISITCFSIVEKTYRLGDSTLKNKVIRWLFFFIGIIIPSLLAGVRANEVGVDIKVYVVPNMSMAVRSSSFSSFIQQLNVGTEILYAYLVYFSSRLTSDEGLLLFLMQLLTIIPIAFSALKMREKVSLPIAMWVYFCCFYNNSLNMMRQSMAVAFIILGTVYLLEKKLLRNKKTLILYAAAFLLHKSALVGILQVYFLISILNTKGRRWLKWSLYLLILFFPIMLYDVVDLLNSWGLVQGNFKIYADVFVYETIKKDWWVNPFSIGILTDVFFRTLLVWSTYIFVGKGNKLIDLYFRNYRSLTFFGNFMYIVILFTMKTVYGGRLTIFYDMFLVLSLPYSINIGIKRTRLIQKGVIIMLLLLYWILWIMVFGWSGSNIYSLRF